MIRYSLADNSPRLRYEFFYETFSDAKNIAKSTKDTESELILPAENAQGYAVFGTDSQGRVQNWNQGAERLLGYLYEEIMGHCSDCLYTPEDRLAEVPERERKQSLELGSSNDDRWQVRKDGSRFWSVGTTVPVRDAEGNARGFTHVMCDRTEWKRQLEAASAMLQTALDCIITMDSRGNVVEFNPAAERTFGYRRSDVIGRELASLIIPPTARESHKKGLAHYLKTGDGPVLGKRIELSAMHADGCGIGCAARSVRPSAVGRGFILVSRREERLGRVHRKLAHGRCVSGNIHASELQPHVPTR